MDQRLLAGRRGRPRAGPVGLCGGSSAGANPISGLPKRRLAGLDRLPLLRRAVLEHDFRRIDRGLGHAGNLGGLGISNRFI